MPLDPLGMMAALNGLDSNVECDADVRWALWLLAPNQGCKA